MKNGSFKLRTTLSFGEGERESGKAEVQSFSQRLGVVLAKVFMEGGRLWWSNCWKERSEILKVARNFKGS